MTIYIADTSALMRHPEIVALFSNSRELLIIPDVILQELDAEGTSSNTTSSLSAKKAMREICKSQNTTFLNRLPEYNPDPLPHDFFSKSNDNRIISIALKRRADHPILISNNPKLCSIAASLNLETISSHEFLESRRSSAAISASPAENVLPQLDLKIVSKQQQIQICFLVRACVDIIDGQKIGAVRLEAGAGRHAILFSASRM